MVSYGLQKYQVETADCHTRERRTSGRDHEHGSPSHDIPGNHLGQSRLLSEDVPRVLGNEIGKIKDVYEPAILVA